MSWTHRACTTPRVTYIFGGRRSAEAIQKPQLNLQSLPGPHLWEKNIYIKKKKGNGETHHQGSPGWEALSSGQDEAADLHPLPLQSAAAGEPARPDAGKELQMK